jgi:hypothetical protein
MYFHRGLTPMEGLDHPSNFQGHSNQKVLTTLISTDPMVQDRPQSLMTNKRPPLTLEYGFALSIDERSVPSHPNQ